MFSSISRPQTSARRQNNSYNLQKKHLHNFFSLNWTGGRGVGGNGMILEKVAHWHDFVPTGPYNVLRRPVLRSPKSSCKLLEYLIWSAAGQMAHRLVNKMEFNFTKKHDFKNMTVSRAPRCITKSGSIFDSDLRWIWFVFSWILESILAQLLVRIWTGFGFGFLWILDRNSRRRLIQMPSTFW